MTSREIREAFLDFFKSKSHHIVPSAPVVVKNDPTLMFTNAGMNQFKDLFLGEAAIKYPRVADTQRCLRVSGKHNDLEEVGIDTYHHTLFEMLGNWSFGDYFKKEAISWSWELLTEVLKLDKDRLYVTIFEGDDTEGLARDTEAYDFWKEHIAEDRILLGNKKDNFWEMGDMGPCGPCSEIHFDMRSDEERKVVKGQDLVNADHPQVIEIWNLVFMQFNRLKNGSLESLPAKHVDTGMGFERLVRCIQGKTSNYDTDVFQPLISFIAEKSGIAYGQDEKTDIAMRVISDHIRAVSFAIADGQLPSNNKAGYVIRRILRRAVRYAYQYLGFKNPFFNELVPVLAEQFKGVFDELIQQQDFVQKVILEEEISFLRTLGNGILTIKGIINDLNQIYKVFSDYVDLKNIDNGLKETIDDSIDGVKRNAEVLHLINLILQQQEKPVFNHEQLINSISGLLNYEDAIDKLETILKTIPSKNVFELYDTYGFPIDLTDLIVRESNFIVDMEAFDKALQAQKERSRAATAIDTGDWVIVNDIDESEFVGYDSLIAKTEVIKYRKVSAKGKDQFQLVLAVTPFYAEGGGQVGDSGVLISEGGETIRVTDTKKENGLFIHFVDHLPYSLEGVFEAKVDVAKRLDTESNHSATHLMHAALKQVLGDHVNQKGSLVNSDLLRFDISHFSKMTYEEIKAVEDIVNAKIRENIALKEERHVPYQQAIESGVTALFGEKYGDFVRVITFDDSFSKELCGGTHVTATGQIGFFKIVSESAVAAGVRRIEAITGTKAASVIREHFELAQNLKDILNNPKDFVSAIAKIMDENGALKKEVETAIREKSVALKKDLEDQMENIDGINFLATKVDLPNVDAVKTLGFALKGSNPHTFIVLGAEIEGKPSLTVVISDALVKDKGFNASTIVRDLAKDIQGGGGGQPFFATAGGKNAKGLDSAIARAKDFLTK